MATKTSRSKKTQQFCGTGRRKTSTARVFIKPGKGVITVNTHTLERYFPRMSSRIKVMEPLKATDTLEKFDILVTVCGGGSTGQADAVRHGIARALVKYNEDFRPDLRAGKLLTRDSRETERKKVGLHKARKRAQYSKR